MIDGDPVTGATVKRRHVLVAAIAVLVAAMVALSQGLVPDAGRAMTLLAVIVMEGAFVLCTLAAAAGYGQRLRQWLVGHERGWAAVQMTLGVAALILLSWTLGWLGWLNGWTAWAVTVVGWALWLPQLSRRFEMPRSAPWPVIVAMPAVALLLTAATLAPGALWQLANENLAHDVLSYHLQLPREWMSDGAIRGYEHNVYSYLPGGFEALYLFLGHQRGGTMVDAAIACQLFHATMALLAAAVVAQTVSRRVAHAWGGDEPAATRAVLAGAASGAVFLAVPWVAVTGSIGFNDQAMLALGAGGLALASDPASLCPVKRGVGAGLLVGAATMVKVIALGMFVLPALVVLLILVPGGRRRALAAVGCIAAAAIPLAAYMTRGYLWTGNPVFPLACEWFGHAHWTHDQAARWAAAHLPGLDALPIAARMARLADEFVAHPLYGYVALPVTGVSVLGCITFGRTRRIGVVLAGVIAVQVLFWLAATHVQGRLALPIVVPLCLGLGLALGQLAWSWRTTIAVIVAAVTTTALGYTTYYAQRDGMAALIMDNTLMYLDPDGDPRTSGDNELMQPFATLNQPAMSGSRIYAEGFARPFYVERELSYHTVWDASPLGDWIDAYGLRGAILRMHRAGYTHLLLDRAMLATWRAPGNFGYDRQFTAERQRRLESLGLPVIAQSPDWVLYRLGPRRQADSPSR